MCITEILKTFVISFQICGKLFGINTTTSLGSRKRTFRNRVRCEVAYICQKQLLLSCIALNFSTLWTPLSSLLNDCTQGRIRWKPGPGQSCDREATAQRFTCPRCIFAEEPVKNVKTDTIRQPTLQRQMEVTTYGGSYVVKNCPWIHRQNLLCSWSLKNILLSLNILAYGVLENSWIVFKLFIFELLITLNIQESRISNLNSGVQRGRRTGRRPRASKAGGIQRAKLQKFKCCN